MIKLYIVLMIKTIYKTNNLLKLFSLNMFYVDLKIMFCREKAYTNDVI